MPVLSHVLLGGRYRVIGRLAVGGMGEIWRGEDTLLERPVAIKVLRADYASDASFRDRFRAEARHAAMLTQPNVTQVFDFVEDDGEAPPCIVMEYVAGESLASILDRETQLDAELTWSILGQTAAALAAAHQLGVVHRDIKPGNILVCPSGLVKVTDFGIARALGEATMTNPGLVLGTVQYLAPEQLTGANATPASDLYALGVVGYRCLTGRMPVDPSLPADLPPELANLVVALLSKDPANRPRDAAEIARQAQHTVGRNLRTVVHEQAVVDPYPTDEPTQASVAEPDPNPGTRVLSVESGQRRRPRLGYPLVLVICALVGVIAALAVIDPHVFTGGAGTRGRAAGNAAAAARPIGQGAPSLVGGTDHPEELGYVTDANPSTAWYTEHYASASFGSLKPGIGLRFSVTQPVRTLLIRFVQPGVAAKMYGDGKAVAVTSSAPSEWRITLPTSVQAQSWVLWITKLVPDSGGYRAGVADVRFFL